MNRRLLCVLTAMVAVLAVGGLAIAHPGGANAPSPDLPPIIPEGYLSPSDVHAKYSGPALQVVLSMIEHQPYAALPPRSVCDPAAGGACHEDHEFQSDLIGMVSINGGPQMPIMMNGPVMTRASNKGPTDITGTFDVEMISMSLTGGGVMIRESPSLPSKGKTSITDIGTPGPDPNPDNGYHIDSFFDVFTELSVDGGMTWIPKAGNRGTRVNLGGVPEPSSVVLAALALIGAAGVSRRRK